LRSGGLVSAANLKMETISLPKFLKKRRTPVRRYAAILLALLAFAPRLFAAATKLSAWDGQYELVFKDGEGEPGEQIYHFYLTLWTTDVHTRALLNGTELTDVATTPDGFSGAAAGGTGWFKCQRLHGINVITLDHVAGADWYLGFLDHPLRQTQGVGAAAKAFQTGLAEIQEFNVFLAALQTAMSAPLAERRSRLQPLFATPLSGAEAERLLAGDYSAPPNRLQRGPLVYVLSGRPRQGTVWPPCLVVKRVNGQFKVTRLFNEP